MELGIVFSLIAGASWLVRSQSKWPHLFGWGDGVFAFIIGLAWFATGLWSKCCWCKTYDRPSKDIGLFE